MTGPSTARSGVVVEVGPVPLKNIARCPVGEFLEKHGYSLFSRTYNSALFRRDDLLIEP